MYSLDINFLNDRAERATELRTTPGPMTQDNSKLLYLGVVVGALLPGLVLGLWWFLQSRNAALEERQAQLDTELAALQAQLSEVDQINQQVQDINTEVRALGSVFNEIKPWSALLQDIRDRVPANVRIGQIEQVPIETSNRPRPAASPSPNSGAANNEDAPAQVPPPPAPKIQIFGLARSFDDANDFLLTLQRSPFLQASETRLVAAELIDNPTKIDFGEGIQSRGDLEVELPQVVQYTIESSLTDLPATQLFQDLERTLAVGLTARIQALRDRGVLQP